MQPKGNDTIMEFSTSRQGTVWLKVISSAPVDKAHYFNQAGRPAGAECCRWDEETGMHYLTMWWPASQNGGSHG